MRKHRFWRREVRRFSITVRKKPVYRKSPPLRGRTPLANRRETPVTRRIHLSERKGGEPDEPKREGNGNDG